MSCVVLTSASGAPGVTTTALGLCLQWPGECVLVDADRSLSHPVLAGYLRGQAPEVLGLQGLLQAHREGSALGEAYRANRVALPPAPVRGAAVAPPRWFLPGCAFLPSVDQLERLWPAWLAELNTMPEDVIIDAGRLGHRGLPPTLLAANTVGLVCRTSLVSLAGLRVNLPPLVEAAPPGRVGLVLVGPGRPYVAKEIAAQFGVPVLAELPWEPRQAGDLADGQVLAPNWARQGLARGFAEMAHGLRTQVAPVVPAAASANPISAAVCDD